VHRRGGQKVLSLDIFAYILGEKMSLAYKQQTLISVLEQLHVVCLFTLPDTIYSSENSWLHSMTDFNFNEEAFKMSPDWDAHAKLSVKKTSVLLKILYSRIVQSVCC